MSDVEHVRELIRGRDDAAAPYLQKLLKLDATTGHMTWLRRDVRWFSHCPHPDAATTRWNGMYAGKRAFTSVNKMWGYRQGSVLNVHITAHLIIWCLHYSRWPVGFVDHIAGAAAGDAIPNLREVEGCLENNRNQKMRYNNTSGCMGVSFMKKTGVWVARIGDNSKEQRYLGTFVSKADAIAARKRAEKELGYHANHGRIEE